MAAADPRSDGPAPEAEPRPKDDDAAPETLVPEDLPEDERIDRENDVA